MQALHTYDDRDGTIYICRCSWCHIEFLDYLLQEAFWSATHLAHAVWPYI